MGNQFNPTYLPILDPKISFPIITHPVLTIKRIIDVNGKFSFLFF